MVYAHNGLQPAPFQLSGNGFSEDVPFATGLLVEYSASLGAERPSVELLDLPFLLLSDPRGDLIKSLELWNEEEGVSEPAVVVLDGSGTMRRLYSGGTDFSDGPPEEALLAALEEVGATDGETTDGGEPEVRV